MRISMWRELSDAAAATSIQTFCAWVCVCVCVRACVCYYSCDQGNKTARRSAHQQMNEMEMEPAAWSFPGNMSPSVHRRIAGLGRGRTSRSGSPVCSAQPMGTRTGFRLDAPFYCVHSHPARWSPRFVCPEPGLFRFFAAPLASALSQTCEIPADCLTRKPKQHASPAVGKWRRREAGTGAAECVCLDRWSLLHWSLCCHR